jgi:hypothetical protein
MIFFVTVCDEFFTTKPTGIWFLTGMRLDVMRETGGMPEYFEA